MEYAIRFIVGGAIVSLFASLADVLRPRSFAGLFGAAPSVALATLTLTLATQGKAYAAVETKSMVVGAFAFLVYVAACVYMMANKALRAGTVAIVMLPLWFVVALMGWYWLLR
jgi:Protein of unknown function (DUF3147)